ncbi:MULTISPECIES: carbohydrate ABC transporter permease [Aerococcus]|uniref:carbohydrate ABC transporter permease n=1 Tax=Aerococcus urinae (strain CCUG 59500 / ACS-120-V-Col10a) TaxID=2976812 RepID=UPI000200E449|nr:sugar ABC transporter permease [Aerococcus sp. Group 1]AEA01455.1 ABC transporter, permease protein [Aerococcus sp. Group 1]MCY3031132.1 sugar ABC transporter permease [Aerococcus sp. Group 1]MCY3054232.1 sugar ABC transporter permease [Aerococcus sp. Group 1]MCY3055962.1 sugar ABC transporter permease [Aerococcus sp. Group 1]MCY3061892.1 sugar ABC transporter permease [Aerococcus sp. Group 1]
MIKDMNKKQWLIYILVPLLPLLIFWFLPMIISLLISFTNWDYISPTYDIVGIENYTDLITSEEFASSLWNTVVFSLGTVIPTLVIGFLLALLLIRQKFMHNFIQACLFAPWVTPMVAVSIVWSWMYQPEGLINNMLAHIGISGPDWLSSSTFAMVAVIVVTVWKNAGWAMLFYSTAMSSISPAYDEVCDIAGASYWQRIRTIYFPMTLPTTLFLSIITLISSIQAYDQINVLTQGGPAGATRTLLYMFYQLAFEEFNMGKATALSVIMLVITGLLAFAIFSLQGHYRKEGMA